MSRANEMQVGEVNGHGMWRRTLSLEDGGAFHHNETLRRFVVQGEPWGVEA